MARHINGAIAERSRTQLGLITRSQLLELGVTRDRLWHLTDSGALDRVEPGVFRIAGAPTSWEQKLRAGLLGLGPEAAVSHRAAGALWPIEGIFAGAVEFTVPRGHRNRLAVGRVHSTLILEDDDVDECHGFRVTSPTRTIVDCAAQLTRRQLEQAVDSACRDKLTTEAQLFDCVVRLRRPGRSRLFLVLGVDGTTGRPHTWLERELLCILRAANAPLPRMQTVLTPERRVARVDGYYEHARLAIEVSGHRTHSTRRQRQADAERRLRLEQAGNRVIEFTYEDVTERPSYVVRTILARLAVDH